MPSDGGRGAGQAHNTDKANRGENPNAHVLFIYTEMGRALGCVERAVGGGLLGLIGGGDDRILLSGGSGGGLGVLEGSLGGGGSFYRSTEGRAVPVDGGAGAVVSCVYAYLSLLGHLGLLLSLEGLE